MRQVPDFVDKHPKYVCKLQKSLYGFKRALGAWSNKLSGTLIHLGFIKSKADNSLFILTQKSYQIYPLVHVDEIIITGSSNTEIQKFINMLNDAFSLKEKGALHFFLGIEVSNLTNGSVLLKQSKYIKSLLAKAHISDAKPANSPMVSSLQLSNTVGIPVDDAALYTKA